MKPGTSSADLRYVLPEPHTLCSLRHSNLLWRDTMLQDRKRNFKTKNLLCPYKHPVVLIALLLNLLSRAYFTWSDS